MRQLESLLRNIPEAERQEALQYYNDYFDDAGVENEQEVIEALGNPARVAENIKRDWLGYGETIVKKPMASDRALAEYSQVQEEQSDSVTDSTWTESAWQSEGGQNSAIAAPYNNASTTYTSRETTPKKENSMPGWAIALIVILIIFASPIGVGLFGVLIGLAATWFFLILLFGIVAVVLFAVLVVLLVIGIICLFIDPWVGISLVGGSFLCGGLGVLFMMLTVAMAGVVTPGIFKGIASLFRKK